MIDSIYVDGYGQTDGKDRTIWPKIVKRREMIANARPRSLSHKLHVVNKQLCKHAQMLEIIWTDSPNSIPSTCSNGTSR
jgi:hypothetical protein